MQGIFSYRFREKYSYRYLDAICKIATGFHEKEIELHKQEEDK
jgi:hypothetical protein